MAVGYTEFSGMMKDVFSDHIKDLIPEGYILQKPGKEGGIPFVDPSEQEGDYFEQPVIVQAASGATFQAANSATASIATLQTIVSSVVQKAQVAGASIIGRDSIVYDVIFKAAQKGTKAFEKATSLVVKNLMKSTAKWLELGLLRGGGTSPSAGSSLGTVSSIVAVTSTTSRVTFTRASWNPAVWAGLENAYINFYNSGTVVASAGAYTLSSVTTTPASDSVGGSIVVTGTSGNCTTLVALNGTALEAFLNNAYGNQCVGLRQIMVNTGTLYGVSASTYASTWRSNTFSCGNTTLNFGKLQAAVAVASGRGLEDNATVLVSPPTFADLVDEQAGARVFDSSYSKDKLENGSRGLRFYSSNGEINIVPHVLQNWGEAMVISLDETVRCGPLPDIVDTLPGIGVENFVLHSATQGVVELRNYANQGVLIEAPAHAVLINNITNQAAA